MNYKIIADSSSNIRRFEFPYECTTVPLKISTDEKEFTDNDALEIENMLVYLEGYSGKSTTSCPNVSDYITAFGDAENVFCITITSGLSGSYNSASAAKSEYESMHPKRHVYVIDSLSTGPEMKLIVEKLRELISEGLSFDEICCAIEEYQKNTALIFSLESLKNLANNGRVSHMTAKLAGALGIRIVGKASDVGTLETLSKSRGEKKAIEDIIKNMLLRGYNGGKVRIDHCLNPVAASVLKEKLLAKFEDADIVIGNTYGLCSFYAERGGLMIGYEANIPATEEETEAEITEEVTEE
ncbi:MAG: DegV family protein [Ruminococcaceae bacterium]|nr:DegV family protein [Oscillospiraceae bacterium]